MLDASNPEASASSNKVKKAKQQNNRPTERFWPNSISVSSNGSQGAEGKFVIALCSLVVPPELFSRNII